MVGADFNFGVPEEIRQANHEMTVPEEVLG
jgi:hypothetical protein